MWLHGKKISNPYEDEVHGATENEAIQHLLKEGMHFKSGDRLFAHI